MLGPRKSGEAQVQYGCRKNPVNSVFTMFKYAKCVQLRGSDVRIQTNATGRGELEVAKLAIKAGVAICLCIVASEWLANTAQKGGLPKVALVWPRIRAVARG